MTNNAAVSRDTEADERTLVSHNGIGEAFLAIMSEVGYVQKKGVNEAQRYKYAGEAQLIEALRPALIKHQVICIPSEAKSRESVVMTGDGKKTFRTLIDYTFVYTHVPSNTHIQVQVIGEGVDTGDKSAYKAATGALKYALRQPFLIETGDEPEAHDLPEDKPKKDVFKPTNGPKTSQEVYGTANKFKAAFVEVQQAIAIAGQPDDFVELQARIDKCRLVDAQAADQLQRELDDRETYIMNQ